MDERLACLTNLRTGSPFNKPSLLLAIICEIQTGHLMSNIVVISDRLMVRYHDLYELLTTERHKANPWLPLWHLRNDKGPSGPLWSPDYSPETGSRASALGQPKSMRRLLERFSSARLDPVLFSVLQEPRKAEEACTLMADHYLSSDRVVYTRLQTYLQTALASGTYEKQPEQLRGMVQETGQHYARSAAFRSLVLEAYDYRCAASRRRFITPDYRYLTEAAHIIPFVDSQNDHPSNGLAMTPDLHWAMDNHLVAPGPDLRWHVSAAVDPLLEDNRWLHRLDGAPLYLPSSEHYQPDPAGLHWRMQRLLR
ncbi:HNH endonuclease [Halomonas salinarum]|uniref:HNH endonuclease n=1 Tax=Halomonas salinarum TaxID=1158993 RepID=UPI00143BC513|nr:HNH endonuclease [Halomonas salinarum]